MRFQKQDPDELLCSICMAIFTVPVTIECGHSFCHTCLSNSISMTKKCPICRTKLEYLPERPRRDHTLSTVVQFYHNISREDPKETQGLQFRGKSQQFLLLDIRCTDLLLPWTKVQATFELQSSSLLEMVDRFIARQQPPFNRYGVLARVTSLNQLKFNIYECTIQGQAFCQIQDETVENNTDFNGEFCYRKCHCNLIREEYEINQTIVEKFMKLFRKIKDQSILERVRKVVDLRVLNAKENSLAAYYSMMRLINSPQNQKYEAIISFDCQQREKYLKDYLERINYDVGRHPGQFIGLSSPGFNKLFVFFLVFAVLFLHTIYADGEVPGQS